MNIGEVAAKSGLNPKTIRYYESRGLLHPLRSTNGYRSYRPSDAKRLRLLAQARKLGLSLSDCETLLEMADSGDEKPGTIEHLLKSHLDTLEQEYLELERKITAVSELLSKSEVGRPGDQKLLRVLSDEAIDSPRLSETG